MSLTSATDGEAWICPLAFIFTAVIPPATCSATESPIADGSSPPTHA